MRKLELRKRRRAAAPVPDPPQSRPRPVRLSGAGKAVLVLGTLLAAGALAVGFFLASISMQSRELRQRIAAEGAVAKGEVTLLRRTGGDKPRYLAEYEYVVNGAAHKGEARLRRAAWERLRVGSPVVVRYLASAPERSWLAGLEPGIVPLWLAPLVSIGIVLIAALCWREIRRQRWLLAEGRLTEGRVLRVTRSGRGSGTESWTIRYEFRTLGGTVIRGKGSMGGNPPDPGGAIRILYDPDNPRRNAPYPLSLVRPA